MNSLHRAWRTLVHRSKFVRLGKRPQFPIPLLTIDGHVEMGDYCRFRNNVTLRTRGNGRIVFGNRSGCSWGCFLEAASEIRIGNYTAIAEYSVVSDVIVPLMGHSSAPHTSAICGEPITIGNDVFVGNGCFIGPGVTIGDGAVIAHHSTVLRDVGPFEIWAGTPARRIAHRTLNVPAAKLAEFARLVEEQGIRSNRYAD
jgi:acetyltransferase-like isoleucine patch superfamily enzyme